MVTTPRKDLAKITKDSEKEMPKPVNTKFAEKEPKEEAKRKYMSRHGKETPICPPTCTGIKWRKWNGCLSDQIINNVHHKVVTNF